MSLIDLTQGRRMSGSDYRQPRLACFLIIEEAQMTRTIFLRVGQKDCVSLVGFISSLQNFLGILRDLDSTISRDQRGSVIWEVVSPFQLHKNSKKYIH
jgi:hypothetical protein